MTDEIDPALKEKYEKLWAEDEIKFGIITALEWHGSTNLKKISSLIDKPESTTLRYIKKLLEDNMLELDQEKTLHSWGKYYKLSKPIEKLYQEHLNDYLDSESEFGKRLQQYKEMTEQEIKEEVFQRLVKKITEDETNIASGFKLYLKFVQNIQNSIANELSNFEERIKEQINKFKEKKKLAEIDPENTHLINEMIQEIQFSPTETSIFVRTLETSKLQHIVKLIDIIRDFHREVKELNEEITKEMDEENVPEEERSIQFVSLFLGGLEKD